MSEIVCPGCDKARPSRPAYERDLASYFDAEADYTCCNPECRGHWGTGCHHCHHPSYFEANVLTRWQRARRRPWQEYVGTMNRALRLLRALALEIDERESTADVEVCRACGARGEVSEWSLLPMWGVFPPGQHRPTYEPTACHCDGPTRPHTIFLHLLVERLAPHPREFFTWPDAWLVALDKRETEGHDWTGRWWLALREWTHAGKEPDTLALARDLAALLPELEARENAKRLLIKCPTCPGAEPRRCCSCGRSLEASEIDLAPCPYRDEIEGDRSPHLQCEACTEAAADDI